jgi:hypothetical protein
LPDSAEAAGLGPVAPLAKPIPGALGRNWFLVDANGAGCGGKPAAIRWRGVGRPGEPEDGELEACTGNLPEAAGAGGRAEACADKGVAVVSPGEPAADASGDPRCRAGSRPLPPGGVIPEFTADTPTSTPPWPLRPPPCPPACGSGEWGIRHGARPLKKAPERSAYRSLAISQPIFPDPA